MGKHGGAPKGIGEMNEPTEPWSLTFLRKEWQEKLAAHRRFQSDQTEMRAITAERRYVFAWRRWKQRFMHASRPYAVKDKDPAIGWKKWKP